MRTVTSLAFAILVAGCGSGGTTPPAADMAKGTAPDLTMSMSNADLTMAMGNGDMSMMSSGDGGLCCGQPGDQGNEKGVGKFCPTGNECPFGLLCASIGGDANLRFCTALCTNGNNAPCGTGATCQCNNQNQCACFPDSCANMPSNC